MFKKEKHSHLLYFALLTDIWQLLKARRINSLKDIPGVWGSTQEPKYI